MKFFKYNFTFLVVILEDQGLTLDLQCQSMCLELWEEVSTFTTSG